MFKLFVAGTYINSKLSTNSCHNNELLQIWKKKVLETLNVILTYILLAFQYAILLTTHTI